MPPQLSALPWPFTHINKLIGLMFFDLHLQVPKCLHTKEPLCEAKQSKWTPRAITNLLMPFAAVCPSLFRHRHPIQRIEIDFPPLGVYLPPPKHLLDRVSRDENTLSAVPLPFSTKGPRCYSCDAVTQAAKRQAIPQYTAKQYC